MASSVRKSEGFRRYALSVQYHGGSLIGFSYQGRGENEILSGIDLRGLHSVEGRLRQALGRFLGNDECFENIQVSSRTDRGVHALKNTLHVDVRPHYTTPHQKHFDPMILLRGVNRYLALLEHQDCTTRRKRKFTPPPMTQIRLLNARFAPDSMYNPYSLVFPEQPEFVDWNARFSATRRTYVYRILLLPQYGTFGMPFDCDIAWTLYSPLNVTDMKNAAKHLVGRHDFSSFQTTGCERSSPEVTVDDILIESQPYNPLGSSTAFFSSSLSSTQLVTITITGNSFLYRQVRNMVGCLVTVGKGNLDFNMVKDILEQKCRRDAPLMAPAQGLFLVDVQHGTFVI